MKPSVVRLLLVGVLAFFVVVPVLAATPVVTLDMPADALVGEQFSFTAVFDNTGPGTGFGPFIDLALPAGITLNTATIGINAVTPVVVVFPAGGCVAHPYAVDTFNVPLQVCGTPGDSLAVLQLPFGSFAVTQPPVEVDITATLSDATPHSAIQTIQARGGFQFGNDELNNPCCDPTVVGPAGTNVTTWTPFTLEPLVMRPEKAFTTGNEPGETATGENFTYTYRITIDIAAGQNISALIITDTLPDTLVLAGAITSPGCIVVAIGAPVNINIDCGGRTGSAAPNDVVIDIPVSVPRLDAAGNPVLGATGTFETVQNSADVTGTWTGPGAGAGGGTAITIGGNNAPLMAARSFATQKGVLVNPDTGAPGPTPGDTLVYTLDFQVSDFFVFDSVILNDTISDGQVWDGTPPQISYTQHAGGIFPPAVPMAGGSFTFTGNPSGTTTASFNVSQHLGGVALFGGCVPLAGTGGGPADCAVFNQGATRGRITYRTVIQDAFAANFPSGDASVDQGDRLANQVNFAGNLLDVATLNPIPGTPVDDALAEVIVQRGNLQKSVYAYNGSLVVPVPLQMSPGDQITYRLQYDIPASDFENLSLADYLPRPIFDAAQVTTFSPVVSAAVPPAGTAKYGPLDTFSALPGAPDPVLLVDPAENSVNFRYGTYDNTTNPPAEIDILLTVTVTNRPFAGNLALSNVMRSSEGSTNNGNNTQQAFFQSGIVRPVLITRKGVVSTTGAGTLNPPVPGPVVFNPPGTNPPFTGTLGSTGLDGADIDSDLNNAASGDTMRFAIVIENTGNEGAFDIVVTDFLPAGFAIPVTGMNLIVTRGDGTPLDYRAVGSGTINVNPELLFGAGLEVLDPGGTPACQTFHPTNGSNIVILTYELTIPLNVTPPRTLTNAAALTAFARAEADTNQVSDLTAYAAWSSVGVGMVAVPVYRPLVRGGIAVANAAAGGASGVSSSAAGGTNARVTKRAGTSLVQRGDVFTWTIEVSNPDALPMTNIHVSDSVVPLLELISADATAGSVQLSGDTMTFTLAVLNPGDTVTITVRTRVRRRLSDASQSPACSPGGAIFINNQTCLAYDGGSMCTQATTYCMPSQLPGTGELPSYRSGLLALLAVLTGLTGVIVIRRILL